ncbi:MAG: hypothetical protein Q8O66_01955 [bacterium]|nr:hypothetical protein [bacterium]
MNKNIIIAIVIVVVILIGASTWYFMNNSAPEVNNTSNTVDTSDTVNTTEPESVQDISAEDTGAGVTAISYANALVKYADRRIQLDTVCQAYPNTVTYKDNTGIMIDNRSPKTRTVKVGVTFTIKPWGFKIVVLPNVYLTSKTLLVDCDQSQNVATVLVQE